MCRRVHAKYYRPQAHQNPKGDSKRERKIKTAELCTQLDPSQSGQNRMIAAVHSVRFRQCMRNRFAVVGKNTNFVNQ